MNKIVSGQSADMSVRIKRLSNNGCSADFFFSFLFFFFLSFFFFFFFFRLLNLFTMILQNHKCVPLEDLAAEFKLRTQVLSVHPFGSNIYKVSI